MKLTLPATETALPVRELLHCMALAREGDRREGILLRQGKGWFQVSGMGHESMAALNYAMRPDDYLFPYYRDRAMALARGVSNYDLALSYFAKKHSSSGGRQMPGHYSDRQRNIFSVATPTAAQCLPGVGAAWSFKLERSDQVVVVTVGDAATRQGEFYEALAFAIQELLPVIFVIEDNRYGISTPTEKFFPYRLGVLGEECMTRVDGRDAFQLYEVGKQVIQKAREGGGPTVLWVEIDRLCSHTSSDDQRLYRSASDLACDLQRDPITRFADRAIADGVLTAEEWNEEQQRIVRQVDEDYIAAENDDDPLTSEITEHLFGNSVVIALPHLGFTEPTTMVAAINQTLQRALEENPKVILFGEDIEDPKGGVFGITKGLSRQFPERVMNSPLAEATIIGSAVGLASTGWMPVFEVQFIDFMAPAINQLMNQVSSLRWRTCGEWSCPMVIMAPYGAYLPGGSIWHSESNEAMWAHIHGLNVVIPSTPEDAAGLLWSVIHGSDPTLFLIPKHIFRKRSTIAADLTPVEIGKAIVRRSGGDVTLVSWGNCMELAEEAAARMAEAHVGKPHAGKGVSVEVIDIRSISPCDYDTVEVSLRKTGRLVVVHEDARTTGFGQCLIAEMTSKPERFNLFLSAPQLVARQDVPIPYNPLLEYSVLPDIAQVLDAIRLVME